jgi:tetratricopeptide (TPR) repeat protein
MNLLTIAAATLLFAGAPQPSPSPLWGDLAPGPHAVGFRQLERYDASRVHRMARDLDGRPRAGERARPIRVSIWYPARPDARAPLTLGDYIAMVAGEERFGPLTPEQERLGEETFFRFPLLTDLSPEQRARLKGLRSRAVRDAEPASGKFPVVLYSLGSAALGHVTPEYLASHGYVVVQAPRVGLYAGLPPDGADGADLVSKLKDMDVLINSARELTFADATQLGALGFSAGGRWALAKAMESPDVNAVVSLDTVMLFKDATTEAWRRLPSFNLDAVRFPVLHLIRRAWIPQEDASTWEQMRYAERTAFVFEDPHLDHLDFQSIGYALTLVGARKEAAPAIAQAFSFWNRLTLAFFDAHLKGDGRSKEILERAPAELRSGFVSVSKRAAQRAPVSLADVMNAIDEGNVDAVERVYRASRVQGQPLVPESVMNLAGYNLLGGRRVAEAIRLFTLNAEAFPDSPNVWDSLGDAYLAAGDDAQALRASSKAKALLEKATDIDPQRKQRIAESIDGKLKRLQKR